MVTEIVEERRDGLDFMDRTGVWLVYRSGMLLDVRIGGLRDRDIERGDL